MLGLIDTSYNDVTRYRDVVQTWRHRQFNYNDPDFDFAGRRVDRWEVEELYQEGKLLAIQCGSTLQKTLRTAIESELLPEIYGQTLPQNTSVHIGLHDVFEETEAQDGELFGHATFSLSFWGYRTPPDIVAYRAAVLQLSIIRSIERSLNDIVGSIACRVYINI